MSALVKTVIVGTLGLLFAVVLGSLLGEGSWELPVVIAGALLIGFIYALFFRGLRIEAVLLGLLVFGYIVGNRGFAQLGIGPVFVGEIGMVACAAILFGRLAVRREGIVPPTYLAYSIVAFLVLGGIRLYFDAVLRTGGARAFDAVRDSATVYYATFFFAASSVGKVPASRRFIERCVLAGCFVLLFIVPVLMFAPQIFERVTVRGYPLIAQKGDLISSYLAFSAFYFFLRPARGAWRLALLLLSLASSLCMLMFMSRAAIVAFGCACLLLLFARQARFILFQVAIGTFALLVLGVLQLADVRSDTGLVGRLSDKISSLTDMSQGGQYRGATGESSAANNQYRLYWWRSVYRETMDKGPWFGLGFGYDLTKDFLRTYYSTKREMGARSPHSIWFTALGRLGIVGVLTFGTLVFLSARDALRAAARVRHRNAEPVTLMHWCAVVVLLGAASFGVVLEGPMGGILFWTFLGLASSEVVAEQKSLRRQTPAHRPEDAELTPEPALAG